MVASRTAVNKPAAETSAQQAATTEATTEGPGEPRPPAKRAAKKPAGKGAAKRAAATGGEAAAPAPAARTRAKKAVKTTKQAAKRSTAAKRTAGKTGAKKVAAKKTTADRQAPAAVPPARAGVPVAAGELAVRAGEEPWTEEEVAEARAGLQEEAERLREEISASAKALTGLMRDSGDGAGDDQADTGTKNVTREHEMALAGNAREVLYQTERALRRLEAGTYGLCESCGNPVGKARMQAFPRATLCVDCKQKQERRF